MSLRPEILGHGTIVENQGELPARYRDRNGTITLEIEWAHEALSMARLLLPDGRRIVINGKAGTHPLFGDCDTISLAQGPILARFQAVNWTNPAHIPPLDRPGALPAGAGTAILNLLAQLALRRGRPALRYRGPYPTGALFDALTECFRPRGELAVALARFTARVEETAATGQMYEAPVDFEPAPFERVWLEAGVCVQLRDGVEKVYVGGRAYARHTAGPRRVQPTETGYVAIVEIGGAPWAEVVVLDQQGQLLAGPKPLPAVTNRFVGRPLPDSVRRALVEALPSRAPRLMQPALRQVLIETPIVWGDPADDVAAIRHGTIVLHAVLLERLAGQSPEAVLTAIALAVETPAQQLAQARLAAAFRKPLLFK